MRLRNKRDSFNVWRGGPTKNYEHNDTLIMKGTLDKILDDSEKFRQKVLAERRALGLE